jgi:cytidylate kinase
MKIDLSKYLTQRYIDSLSHLDFEGPVITIAREFGCPGKKIAYSLVQRLDEIKGPGIKPIPWRCINKEIISASASELNLDPDEIKYVFKYEKKTFFDDILSSQSRKYYKSDRKIRSTIARVIRNIASEGNVVILGRGGVAITREMDRSLHVMLEAPLNWRALRVMQKYGMTEKEAMQYSSEIDRKRKELRDYYHGKGTDYTRFDVRYNCMTLSIENISDSILGMMKSRNLL